MENLRSRIVSGFAAFASILILTNSVDASTIVSVTSPPGLSSAIGPAAVATSWSQTNAYVDVTIQALVDSLLVGESPMGTAYLTTRIGPGTTSLDEIAAAPFTVPLLLPVCSGSNCGANVTLFSGLILGPAPIS